MDGISASAFTVRSSIHPFKGFALDQLVFLSDKIMPIKHRADWKVICQKKRTEINYNNVQKK